MSAAEPLTITDAAPLIHTGRLTPSGLLEQCLVRVDQYEPHVKAWVYLDRERARLEAAQLTDEIKKGHYRGPLHGIPVGIKDIIDVFDMPTGCGSKLWANSYARRDATCVERLRQAGALILGKTVTTPYAYLDPSPTRNPWNLDRTPGGSSSGSAAAVACGMCLAALGTQTGGSLTRPASYCGVCSLKPSYGRVSTDGVLPLATSLDHIGVMANCVHDLTTVFEAIGGNDPDHYHGDPREEPTPECSSRLDQLPDGFRWLRYTGPFTLPPGELCDQYEGTLARLRLPVEQVATPVEFTDARACHLRLMAFGAWSVHRERLDRHPNDYPAEITKLVSHGANDSDPSYGRALLVQRALTRRVRRQLEPRSCLVAPATTDFAPSAETTGSPAFNSPWSFLGLPTVSVPAGWSADGLPFAVQVIGRRHDELTVLQAAYRLEEQIARQPRLPPVPG